LEEAAKTYGPMVKLMYNEMGDLCSAFYKKYGKDALPIISKISAKYGVEFAKIAQKMMPIKNMKDYAEMYKMMMTMVGEKMDVIKVSDDVFHFRSSHCPMGLEGTSQELCEAMMVSDNKMLSTLFGRPVDTKLLKSLPAGDKCCEAIYTRK
jgi:predicted hydrocarbon binding protein